MWKRRTLSHRVPRRQTFSDSKATTDNHVETINEGFPTNNMEDTTAILADATKSDQSDGTGSEI